MATHKRVVVHPNLYLSTKDGPQRMAVGTELTLTDAQIAGHLGRKTAPAGEALSLKDGELVAATGGAALPAEVQEALVSMQKKLDASQAELAKLKKATKK